MSMTALELETFRLQQYRFFALMAHRGDTSWPVYSGDIATAFAVNHRALKTSIEKRLRYLRKEYGPTFRVQQKKAGITRSMNGYCLPANAVGYVLIETLGERVYRHCDPDILKRMC